MSQLPPDEGRRERPEVAPVPAVVGDADAPPPADELFAVLFGDEIATWPARSARRGVHLTWPVMALVGLLLVVGGVGLGSYLQRTRPTSAASILSQFSRAAGARTGVGGFAGAGTTASAGVTAGTVTDVIGRTLYVTTASGSLVKVEVSPSTTIDRNASSSLGSLTPGDTVIVQGSTEKGGTVRASSIADTAKGVTSTGFAP